ncbi:caspase family protein [Hyalangium versicolor]|uniref:caspase family protein n=1 Tax=Hyalangium versicolor TaxID=2861190 RepID=UPI001CCD9DA8|nr:caspase family protein [Hyalangium versicolor]
MTTHFPHGYALLIGVGLSHYAPYSLPVTSRDAQLLRSVLTDPARCAYSEDHIRLLHDEGSTREAIMEGLTWLSQQAESDHEATIIVFFSGHGWREPTGAYFLLPHDIDPSDVPGSAIRDQDFTDALRAIQARRLLTILDCCHAGGMATSKSGGPTLRPPAGLKSLAPPQELISALKEGAGRAIFSSSLGAQESWTRLDGTSSLYTHHLIEALQGAASLPGESVVRLSDLMTYLSQAVPASAQAIHREQTPFFDTATENFPIAMLLGGKGVGARAARPSAGENPPQPVSEASNHFEGPVKLTRVGDIHNSGTMKDVNISAGDIIIGSKPRRQR